MRFARGSCWRTMAAAVCAIVAFGWLGSGVAKGAGAPQAITLDDLELKYVPYKKDEPGSGVLCSFGGTAFSIGSQFAMLSRNWKETYVHCTNPGDFAVEIVSQSAAGKSMVFKISKPDGHEGFIRYTLRPGNVLEIELNVKLANPGVIVFDALRIEPAAVEGLDFIAETKAGRQKLQFTPFRQVQEMAVLLKDFEKVSIDSRLGRIAIQKLPGSTMPIQISDWRRKKWHPRPCFDIGATGDVAVGGGSGVLKMRMQFPKAVLPKSTVTAVIESDKWKKGSVVAARPNPRPELFPTPKKVQFTGGRFALSPQTALVFQNVPEEDQAKLSDIFARILAQQYGFAPNGTAGEPAVTGNVELRILEEPLGSSPEHYKLSVSPKGTVILANTAIGLRHGLMTLGQLLWADPNAPAVVCAEVSDWPSLPMRGVHCFSGNNAVDLQIQYVERIFSPCKLNTIVYECGYVKWNRTPLAHHATLGMEKDQAARVVESMRSNYLEPIPLIQSLGHIDWLNRNTEVPGKRAYGQYLVSPVEFLSCFNPLNEDGVKFLHGVYDEVIEMFQPRFMHLGFDECLIGPAQLEALSKTSGVAIADLFVKQLLSLRDYLKDRGIRPIIWGDVLLMPREEAPDYGHAPSLSAAKAMRERIPKDVVIADWHYGLFKPEKFVNIKILQDHGFDVLGCTWYSPGNLIWFNTALKKAKSMGHLQTTWAGFSFDQKCVDMSPYQFYAHTLGSEAAWNGDYAEVEDVPFNIDEKFVQLWTKNDFTKYMKPGAEGWFVNMSDVANIDLANEWLGVGADNAIGEIKMMVSNEVAFRTTEDGRIDKAVLFDSEYNRRGKCPAELVVSVNRKFDALLFIQAASKKGQWDEQIAEYTITYDDGSRHAVPLKYGRNVFWHAEVHNDRPWDNHNSPLVWRPKTKAGQPLAVRYLKVDNPHPDKTIDSLAVTSAGKGPALILFGIGGLKAGID